MAVTAVVRVKLAIFAIICFVLWQAMRSTVPSAAPIANAEKSDDLPPNQLSVDPVKVAVYYESLCPDSRSFITKQLLPSYEKAARLIHPILIPYGKAQTQILPDQSYRFTCQHGPLECQGNKVHACAIEKVKDRAVQLKYIACMISDNMDPEAIGTTCSQQFGVSWEPILQCSRGREGDILLEKYGRDTHGLSPAITFIPTVLLNGNRNDQVAILKNLLLEVCNTYSYPKPKECS